MERSIKFLSKAERERPSDRLACDQVKASSSFSSQRPNHKRKERQEAMASRLANLEREKELEAIKEQYLSPKPKKRVIIKPSEKFRFSFDWDNSEDTSRDINSLYQDPHEAKLLFGRGFRGGVDRREQKKKNKLEDLHWREKKLEAMTERDWRIFQEDSDITYEYYKGGGCSNKLKKIPRPMRSWAESNLCSKLLMAVERNGYKKPSPIQMAAIPLGLQQRDAIGIAQTGSGKTAAFVIPMLSYISSRRPSHKKDSEDEGPYALVLVPTRELALQIEKETLKLAHYLDIKVISVVGGHSIEKQGFKVSQGCDVLVATPWRLLDLLERRYVVLNNCNYVVLDEADQMVNMGFEPQVLAVLDAIPSSNLKPEHDLDDENMIYRTTYMFSATMSPAVEKLARKYLRNPVVVRVGTVGKASELVTQNVVMTTESEKLGKLKRLLDEQGDHKTAIVFVNTRRNVDTVAKNLDDAGYCVTTLHGGKTQEQRELSLEGFRSKRHNVLVATDVAGRGIDVPDVAHVINFDMPRDIEKYTHRIGRTGRAGKRGTSTTFLTKEDRDIFYELKRTLS